MKLLVALIATFLAVAASAQNIVIVTLDDVGVDKVGVYSTAAGWGTAAPTPTVDALAAAGMRFDRFMTNLNCSPTRATFMMGTQAWRHGVGTAIQVSGSIPSLLQGMDERSDTLPKSLVAAGYDVEMIGKWHLCSRNGEFSCETQPTRAGFQYFSGLLGNPNDSVTGLSPTGYTNYEWCDTNGSCSLLTTYVTTKEVNEAITRLNLLEADSSPHFFYLALNAPHDPFACPPNALTPTYDAVCTPIGGETATQALYNAILEAADTELARFIAEINFTNTTLFLFGDNGTPQNATEAPFVALHAKGSGFQGGVRTPLIVRGELVVPASVGDVGSQLIQVADIPATILDIADVETTSFRDGISMLPYLANSAATSRRTVSYAEAFAPNGLPFDPTATHIRRAETAVFSLILQTDGDYELFNMATDYFEATDLDDGVHVKTAAEQTAFELLQPKVDDPYDHSEHERSLTVFQVTP